MGYLTCFGFQLSIPVNDVDGADEGGRHPDDDGTNVEPGDQEGSNGSDQCADHAAQVADEPRILLLGEDLEGLEIFGRHKSAEGAKEDVEDAVASTVHHTDGAYHQHDDGYDHHGAGDGFILPFGSCFALAFEGECPVAGEHQIDGEDTYEEEEQVFVAGHTCNEQGYE